MSESMVLEAPATVNQDEALPPGLRWRGGVLWIAKKIEGRRYQRSTGCRTLQEGVAVYETFLAEHGQQKLTAGAGRRLQTDRAELPKGRYWKGKIIWLSKSVKGEDHNL